MIVNTTPVSVVVVPLSATAPGVLVWPAKAETASVNVRIAIAHCLRKVFTFSVPPRE